MISRRSSLAWVFALFVHAAGVRAANFSTGAEPAVKFGVHEIVLTGDSAAGNPFDTPATVTFTPPRGAAGAKTVDAFFDGENIWRARVYAGEPGRWTWTSQCAGDPKLHGRQGTFTVADSKLRGRLLVHPKNRGQWMTEDGRWFLNLNDTAYFWLGGFDGEGKAVSEQDAHDYVRDVAERGITSLRSFLITGPSGFQTVGGGWRAFFADEEMSRLRLTHFQTADARLRWLLDGHPELYMQIVLFPMGCPYGRDQQVWQTFSAAQRERIMRNIIARYAAYPQVFWLAVNDVHFGPRYPLNGAFAREVGEYFAKHDPWRHPFSTGHARKVEFAYPDEDWVTYLHLEDKHDLGASLAAKYASHQKPVFLGEDRYEQDHGSRLDPAHMDCWQRRLFWSWLLAGGSASYGGRWWCVHPYSQTGRRPAARPIAPLPEQPFTAALDGLDSVKFIRDYFAARHIELSDFEPNDALVKDADGATGARAPKLAHRAHTEWLIYHPHASADDDQHTRPAAGRAARLAVDLRTVRGEFTIEWFRAADGETKAGSEISGGAWRDLTAPWPGADVVVRLLKK